MFLNLYHKNQLIRYFRRHTCFMHFSQINIPLNNSTNSVYNEYSASSDGSCVPSLVHISLAQTTLHAVDKKCLGQTALSHHGRGHKLRNSAWVSELGQVTDVHHTIVMHKIIIITFNSKTMTNHRVWEN